MKNKVQKSTRTPKDEPNITCAGCASPATEVIPQLGLLMPTIPDLEVPPAQAAVKTEVKEETVKIEETQFPSETKPGVTYKITKIRRAYFCSCPDFRYRRSVDGSYCKHILAFRQVRKMLTSYMKLPVTYQIEFNWNKEEK